MLNIISLGAGVQSSTMALMAAHGEITPMPDCAIFADTQSEPQAVYDWLNWLEPSLPFPVYRVTAGSLREQILGATRGENRMDGRPPFFVGDGMLRRQCTHDFKITPIKRKVGELIGHRPKTRWPLDVVAHQWIGISTDEASRMKPSGETYVKNRWPLIEAGISRADCIAWLKARAISIPTKSACTFCPYRDDKGWLEMKVNDRAAFADAVAVDEAIRHGMEASGKQLVSNPWFVHESKAPLVEIDFQGLIDAAAEKARARAEQLARQGVLFQPAAPNKFENECEGMCGV